jgi:hypothetical protein
MQVLDNAQTTKFFTMTPSSIVSSHPKGSFIENISIAAALTIIIKHLSTIARRLTPLAS